MMLSRKKTKSEYRLRPRRLVGAIVVLLLLVGVLLLQRTAVSDDPNEVFVQTDWSQGDTADTMVHPDNKTGWQKYQTKDDTIRTASAGRVMLETALSTITDTSDTHFGEGALSGIEISGSGDDASLLLEDTFDNPFVDNVGQWVSPPEAPYIEWSSPFVKAGSYVYCLWNQNVFGRWDITNEKWEFMANTPQVFGVGAGLAYPGSGDFIYAVRGDGTKDFWKYSISGDSWSELTDVSYNVRDGSALTASATKVYCAPGWVDSRRKFLAYDISGESWSTLTDTSYDSYYRGTLVCPDPSGSYIYHLARANDNYFYRYNISSDSWNDSPDPTDVTRISYPGNGNYIYAWRDDDGGRYFQRFDLSLQTWSSTSTLPRVPTRVDNGIIYYPGSGNKIKLLSRYNYSKVLNFDTSTEEWDDLMASHDSYYRVQYGSRFIYDGGDYIYKTAGGAQSAYFQRYKISTNTWENLANQPTRTHTGGSATYHNDYFYTMRGENTGTFMRYDPSANSWSYRAGAPGGFYYGSALCGAGSYIYGLRGYNSASFYRYKLASNTWSDTAVADAPAAVYYGGALVYPDSGDYIYASRGNGNRTFWKYSISGDVWTEVAAAPFGFYYKGTLTYPGSGNYIYAFFGQYENFARYNFVTDAWEPLVDTPYAQSYHYVAEAVGDKIYYTYYDRIERDLYCYTISTGEWDLPKYSNTYAPNYGSAVYDGDDTAYMVYGSPTKNFWKYTISTDKWAALIEAPFLLGTGTKAAYPGSGDLIYVLRGRGTKDLWTYNKSTGAWLQKADAPWPVDYNSQLDSNGDLVYACPGIWDAYKFAQYTISTDTWEEKTDMPDYISGSYMRGNRLVYVPSAGTSGRVYVHTYEDTNIRYFDLNSELWGATTTMPGSARLRDGSAIYYPGTGSDFYVFAGNYNYKFFKYSTSGDSWTTLSNPPSSTAGYGYNYDCDMFIKEDLLYLWDSYRNLFARYSLSEDSWDTEVGLPENYQDDYRSCFSGGSDGDTLYSGGYQYFYKYDISNRTWAGLTSPYNSLGWRWDEWDPQLTYAYNTNYLYTSRGRNRSNFARYSISGNGWEELTAPGTFLNGHMLTASSSYVYCFLGGGLKTFSQYNPILNTWTTLADLPVAVNWGSSLLYPGRGSYIYALAGNGTSNFYRYNILLDAWEALEEAPCVLGGGSSGSYGGANLVYPGVGDYMFLTPGSPYSSQTKSFSFYKYSISGNSWSDADPAPAGFVSVNGLVYPGSGDYLYGKRGYGYSTYEGLFKYLVYKGGTYTSEIKDAGRNKEYDIVTWNDNSKGAVDVKVRTTDNSAMSGASSWASAPPSNKGEDLSNAYPAVESAETYLQYQVGLYAYDIADLPALNDISIKTAVYPHKAQLISSAYDSGDSQNRLMKLTWDETQLAGTDVRLQLRTAPDNSGTPGVWSTWLGPGGTQTLNDDYSTESDYAYDSSIEVTSDVARLKKIYEDFAYTQRIILDNSAGVQNYENGVFILNINSDNDAFWDHVKSDGGDVRFADEAGEAIVYNLSASGASFDYANKAAVIYLRISSISAGEKLSVYLKYGNVDATTTSDGTVKPLYEDFNDEGLDTDKFATPGGATVTQTGGIASLKNNNWSWDAWLETKETFAREVGKEFRMKWKTSGGMHNMMGWRNSGSGGSYNQLVYSLHLSSGTNWYIYENGSNKGSKGSHPENVWYELKIVLKDVGATYYWRQEGVEDWTLLHESTTSSATDLKGAIIQVNTAQYTQTDDWNIGEGGGGIDVPYYFTTIAQKTTSASLSGWDYREEFDIDNTDGGQQNNYQVKVELTASHDDFWSKCRSDGYDVRFVDSDNTVILNYYRSSFDYANKTATFWVKLPTLTAGSIERIYLYYGKSDASDTSSFDNTLVKDFGEPTVNISGVSLDGSGAKALVADSASLDIAASLTLETVVNHGLEGWVADSWGYRKKLTFDNSGGAAQSNYGVKFDLAYQAAMNADFSDLRFYDGSRSLTYRIKSSTPSVTAEIWLTIPTLPADSTKDVYLYYGNASASSESDDTLIATGLSCKHYSDTGSSTNGTYSIDPDGQGGEDAYDEYCDMTADDGGWTRFLQFSCAGSCNAVPSKSDWQTGFTKAADAGITEWLTKTWTDSTYSSEGGQAWMNAYVLALHANYQGSSFDDELGLYDTNSSNHRYYHTFGTSASKYLQAPHSSYESSENPTYQYGHVWGPHGNNYQNGSFWGPYSSNSRHLIMLSSNQYGGLRVGNASGYAQGGAFEFFYREDTDYGYSPTTPPTLTPAFGSQEDKASLSDLWLPGFPYRKKVTIDNSGGSVKENRGMLFDVTYVAGKMNSDFSDLRFIDTDGTKLSTTILDYTEYTTAEVLLVVPYIKANSTKDVFMYYGNASASGESGDSSSAVAASCKQHADWGSTTDGVYEIDPDGTGGEAPFDDYCDMTTDGGGWSLVMNIDTTDGHPVDYWADDDFWTSTSTYGSAGLTADYKGQGWNVLTGSEWLIKVHEEGTGVAWRVWPILSANQSKTMYDFFQSADNTLIVGASTKEQGTSSLHVKEPVVRYADEFKVNAYWGNSNSQERSRLRWNNASTSDNYVGGIGHDWDTRAYKSGKSSWPYGAGDAYLGYVHYGSAGASIIGTDYWYPSSRHGCDNPSGVNYDYSFFLREDTDYGSPITPAFGSEEDQPAIDFNIVGKAGAYEIKFTQSGLSGLINGTEQVSTPNYSPGSLMHTALTYDGSNVKLYLNGALEDSASLTGAVSTNSNDLLIGDGVKGLTDEVRVWNIARPLIELNLNQWRCLDGDETGLVAYLRFNENTGTTAADITGNSNNAVLSGGAGWYGEPYIYANGRPHLYCQMEEGSGTESNDLSGFLNVLTLSDVSWLGSDLTGFAEGNAQVFNGTSSYTYAVDSASLDVTEGKVSLEVWFKPDAVSGTRILLKKGDDALSQSNYALIQEGSGVAFGFYNGSAVQHTKASVLSAANTYHLVATYDEAAGEVKLYLNGVEVYSGSETTAMIANDDDLYLGRNASGASPFIGSLDGLRIYKRILTPLEILCHYQQRLHAVNEPDTLNIYEPAPSVEYGAYATDHPVVQPVLGVFYTDKNIIEFQEVANKPWETEIKYQISANGYSWYWHNGAAWVLVDGGYSQANTAADINTNLSTFQDAIAQGDFYYRAYLHSDTSALKTPSLSNIAITLLNDETYYLDPTGATAIQAVHSDASNDQWFQYRTLLYSEGEATPVLNDLNMEYIDAYITVTAPNGGEKFGVTGNTEITWTSQAITKTTGLVKIEYSADGGSTYSTIASNEDNDGSYSWDPIPDSPSQQGLIKISSEDFITVSDTSDATFKVMAVEVTSPNGGEIWERGRNHNVTWTTSGTIPNNVLKVELSIDGGSNWTTVANPVPNSGTYSWTIPSQASDNCLIRMSSPSDSEITDVSDVAFSLVPIPAITISAPEGGETWYVGEENTVSWTINQLQFSDNVTLNYSNDDFLLDTHEIATVSSGTDQGTDPNDNIVGSYDWTVADAVSGSLSIKIIEADIPAGRDTQSLISKTSSDVYVVEPAINIATPEMGDVLVVGDVEDITWTSQGSISDDLLIEYSLDGGNYSQIVTGEANDGTYSWTIGAESEGATVSLRITDNQRTQVTKTSGQFEVLADATLTLSQPNGGEELMVGSVYEVKWSTIGKQLEAGGTDYDKISLYYSSDNGSTWTIIVYHANNTGSYEWTVADAVSDEALIKLTDDNDADVADDLSDAVFSITPPTITVIGPNGGELWYATGAYDITWSSVGGVNDNLTLEYSADGGTTWGGIATGELNDGEYTWSSIADVEAEDALIKITDASRGDCEDESNSVFTITTPTITIGYPNGGEQVAVGEISNVTWSSAGASYGAISDNLTIQYSSNNGTTWSDIITGETNDGLYQWMVADDVSDQCLLRMFDAQRTATTDDSDAVFAIVIPYVTISAPNGGEAWPIGSEQAITWVSVGSVSDSIKIEYSKDNFSTIAGAIATGEADDGTYTWTIPDDLSSTVKVRIWDTNKPDPDVDPDNAVSDKSDTSFGIVNPTMVITAPNGGEQWTVADTENITWDNIGGVGNDLKIEYSKDNFQSNINVIAASTTNTGTYAWEIPDDLSTSVKIRITDNTRPAVVDKSNTSFIILPAPVITFTAPEENDIWRYGTVQDITWTDNGGLISNNLTIRFSTDNGASWPIGNIIAESEANDGSYSWTIPENFSALCKIRIKDMSRETTVFDSPVFEIALPLITITAPNGGEVWAVGDKGPVTWTTEGAVSDNLILEYSPDDGSSYYLVKAGQENTGSYQWTVPDNISASALFRIKDGDMPAVVDVSDANFWINPMPTMEITQPNGGEIWVLGDTENITWDWTGLSISDNLLIEGSNDDFATTRQVIASAVPNTGTYAWTISGDSLTGSTLKIRITDGDRTEITDKTNGYYKIRGGFTLLNPDGGESWGAKSTQTISWQTQGNITNVKLDYSVDDGVNWSTIAASTTNSGSYSWILPDIQEADVLVRVSDPTDAEVADQSDAGFDIVYMTVQFKMLDYDTMEHLLDISATEPNSGWADTGLESPVLRTNAYPFGTYTTFFTKTNYIDTSVTWSPPKFGTDTYVVTVYLENSASAQVTWDAILTYSFSPANDSLSAVGSLQRKGKLVGTRAIERLDMGGAAFTIYEPGSDTVKHELLASFPSETGMYNFTLADTGFEAGYVYPATLSITYRDRPYISSANIDVGSEILQYEFFTETAANLAASVEVIEEAVGAGTAQTRADIEASRLETTSDIESSRKKTVADIAASRESLETYITTTKAALELDVEEARHQSEVSMLSRILNRENIVKQNSEIPIRFRTYSGLAPIISVYDADNTRRVENQTMTEIGTTGIYEYEVKFKWGKGDYSVICSEESLGTMDGLIISVLSSDLTSIAGQVSSVVGTTSSLSDIGDTAELLNNQVGSIESALDAISKDIVEEVRGAISTATDMEDVFGKLSEVGKRIREIQSSQDFNLDEFLDLEEDKKDDMDYLKNKTNEIKAVMELNQKMIDNVANEPIIQTWYEYKSVVIKAIIVNPSETQTKTVPFKIYLPKEAKPEHVLFKGELNIDYDTQQGSYYAHSNYEMKPKESKVIEIEMTDIWMLEDDKLVLIRREADKLYALLKNTEFSDRSKYLIGQIKDNLDTIVGKQEIKEVNPEVHISNYRDNMMLYKEIEKNLALVRTLLSQAAPFSVSATWKVIVAIVAFLGILSLGFYIIWQKQVSINPDNVKEKKVKTDEQDKAKEK